MSNLDCRHCRDWGGCPGKWYRDKNGEEYEWYSYAEIQWCPRQVLWILRYADSFDDGEWPKPPELPECDGKRKNVITEATFCKPKNIIGEVRARLKSCRDKGRILERDAMLGESISSLDRDVRDVLYYASGWNRKQTPFRVWRAKKRYQNVTKTPSLAAAKS